MSTLTVITADYDSVQGVVQGATHTAGGGRVTYADGSLTPAQVDAIKAAAVAAGWGVEVDGKPWAPLVCGHVLPAHVGTPAWSLDWKNWHAHFQTKPVAIETLDAEGRVTARDWYFTDEVELVDGKLAPLKDVERFARDAITYDAPGALVPRTTAVELFTAGGEVYATRTIRTLT